MSKYDIRVYMVINFESDKVKISGPRVDGSYTATFDIGEYNQRQVSELLLIPQMTELKVRVEYGKEKTT